MDLGVWHAEESSVDGRVSSVQGGCARGRIYGWGASVLQMAESTSKGGLFVNKIVGMENFD